MPAGHKDPLCQRPAKGQFNIDRWEVLQLVKDTATVLGISDRDIAVLGAHLSVLPKGPIKSGQLLMSFMQVSTILPRANCMEERGFRRSETRLEETALVARKLSANGRRFAVRDASGRIVDAYGIDLEPLFLRIGEFREIRARLEEERQRKRALISRVTARLTDLKRWSADHIGYVPDALSDLAALLRNQFRRKAITVLELCEAEAQVDALETKIIPQTEKDALSTRTEEPPLPCPESALATVDMHVSPKLAFKHQSKIPRSMADKSTVDAGHTDRHIDSKRKEYNKRHAFSRPDQDLKFSDIQETWSICMHINSFYTDSPETAQDLWNRVIEFSSFLGLGQANVLDVVAQIGWRNALLVMDYIAQKIAVIKAPQAYLAKMLDSYQRGHAIAAGRVCRSGRPAGQIT